MKCPACGTETGGPRWKARTHIMWANRHGRLIRVFCQACGAWSDHRFHQDKYRWRYVGDHKPNDEHNDWRES